MRGFKTSYGTVIEDVEGYRDAHLDFTASDVFPSSESRAETAPFGIDGFIKDVYEYALMIDFMESVGVTTSWDRTLDIGGAEGTMARLLRGEGRAHCAAVVEVKDIASRLPTSLFVKHWCRFRAISAASRFSPRLRRFLLGDGEWRGKRLTALYLNFGYVPPRGSTFWTVRLRAIPRLDRFIVGDVYALQETFDLVTSFLSLPCFDHVRLFEKVGSLLTEGGTFFVMSDNWWFPVNSAVVVGDFPYVSQRLSKEDFRRYVEERHPGDIDDWMSRYEYSYEGRAHPTLDDCVEVADRFGLELIGARRLFPPYLHHHRAAIPPRQLNRHEDTRLVDILADVRHHRPDVGLLDLMCNYVMAIFRKRPARSRFPVVAGAP